MISVFTLDAKVLFDDGALTPLARRKRLLAWLRDRLATRGIEAQGPSADLRGWRLCVQAEEGCVTLRLARGLSFAVRVEKQGEADAEYEDTVAACADALSAEGGVRER